MRHLLLSSLLIACGSTAGVGFPQAGKQGSPKPSDLEIDARRATPSETAVRNFESGIEGTRRVLATRPDDQALRARLVETLLARTVFFGTFDDFDEVDRLTTLGDSPSADDHMQRASFLSSVHRFEEASAQLDLAAAGGAPAHVIERMRLVIELALGRSPTDLLPRAEALAEASPAYGQRTLLASVLAAAGRYDDADAMYELAMREHRDVSPFPLAWVAFTRGVMWGEAADRPDLARPLYEEAVRRLPQYVVANVHLSELEEDEGAIARLERFVETGDPEPAARLSERVEGERKETLLARSRARYEELLSKHHHAFLDHGAEFYMIAGEPARALELAQENVAIRKNGRAYVVAIDAAREAGQTDTLCGLAREAEPLRSRHRVLDALLREVADACVR